MHTLSALVLVAAASAVIGLPPGPVSTTASHEELPGYSPTRKYSKGYVVPQIFWPHYFAFRDTPQAALPHNQRMPASEWLNQEIDRLSRMHMSRTPEISRRVVRTPPLFKRWPASFNTRDQVQPYYARQPWPAMNLISDEQHEHDMNEENEKPVEATAVPSVEETEKLDEPAAVPSDEEKKKTQFALTPHDEGFFAATEFKKFSGNLTSQVLRVGGHDNGQDSSPKNKAKPTEQNLPNQIKKVAEKQQGPKMKLGTEAMKPQDDLENMSRVKTTNAIKTFYDVSLLSAIIIVIVFAILGFVCGWYKLSKRAKDVADVDYPAYGVTGPTMDASGDRKLAHSAHMYHYQHQKQQIIAMERSEMDQRSGSASDIDSDDDNEEGDYTVYECPGFATTGATEVKNPLFNEEPTPATPSICEVVKPQPKE